MSNTISETNREWKNAIECVILESAVELMPQLQSINQKNVISSRKMFILENRRKKQRKTCAITQNIAIDSNADDRSIIIADVHFYVNIKHLFKQIRNTTPKLQFSEAICFFWYYVICHEYSSLQINDCYKL